MSPVHELQVRRASAADLAALSVLFDGYRRFYGKPADVTGARKFLEQRFARGDSALFVAFRGRDAVGFTQLYPSLSSVSMARIEILNDLFVTEAARGSGAGQALVQAGVAYAREQGAVRVMLSTARTNTTAQRLYESLGWVRDEAFLTYEFALR